MKYNVYTTDPERYLKGRVWSLIIRDCEDTPNGWAKVGEVEFTPTAPESDVREAAVKGLDRKMSRKLEDFMHGTEGLQRRKEELLAITHQQEDES